MRVTIPVVLFTYARPDHLRRTLESLKANNIPVLYIFSDAAKSVDKEPAVRQVRKIIHEIDWCETIITERDTNYGLGKSILSGVTEILKNEEMVIVFEDDLICVPGTYDYLCAALEYYRNNSRVMSVTGWTHPLVTPKDVTDQPYFDALSESWTWGTWARAWNGMMKHNALSLMKLCEEKGIDVYRYGSFLPEMAYNEKKQNIWAVRFLYRHILNKGLCLRPPWSMVEHIGWDLQGTNAQSAGFYAAQPLKACPPVPKTWPEPRESIECSRLWKHIFNAHMIWYKYIFNIIMRGVWRMTRIFRKC